MLCQFTVKNYKCIKNEMTLDMQATNISENENSLLVDKDNEKFLPLAAIYGPNGAGKSTVLNALYSLICKVMKPICAVTFDNEICNKNIEVNNDIVPFKFDKKSALEPTEFELFFRTELHEFQYNISILSGKVISESLYKKNLDGVRYSPVFVREQSKITLSGTIKNYAVTDITDQLPLLSFLFMTHGRNELIKDAIKWFDESVKYVDYSFPMENISVMIPGNPRIRNMMLKMLSEMDIDIVDFRIEELGNNQVQIYTVHQVCGERYELPLHQESNGTLKIFGMIAYIIESLYLGKTLIIDELDAKLHPLLLQYIIGLYNDPTKNIKNAQLLFTSHDLTTMNSNNFRRDEIWFVARNEEYSTKLYSLVEFKKEDGTKERKDARYDKRYLEGKYGADPYLKKIIDWGDINE